MYDSPMTFMWILVFIVSLAAMLRGGDYFIDGAEKIGLAFGLSPFVVGTTIVAAGTSFPELLAGLFAIGQGAQEIVLGNVIGSNIANILLVLGVAAVFGKALTIKKDISNLDLPLLAITTGLFIFIVWDGVITFPEAIILLLGQVVYFLYTFYHREDVDINEMKPLRVKMSTKDILLFIGGGLGLILGARFLITSVISLSEIWNIGTGVIAISAIAFGTSLPELIVSVRAALAGKGALAFGNIFGSNVFNIFIVAGIPALITPLTADEQTMAIGLPFLVLATLLFLFSGLSRRLYIWEGLLFLLIYILFIGKLFGFL